MLELIAAGVIGVAGHIKSKDFTRTRLRYTGWIEKPGLGLFVGAATAVVAAPLVAVLPLVGAGTAIALGAGVGTGVAIGARQARMGWLPEE
jgi:hypothetical protein